uniref:Uncharacterized protein n=1 Tax=Strigamia maritima TaxID=126957 RepID=T1JBW8_STRMM
MRDFAELLLGYKKYINNDVCQVLSKYRSITGIFCYLFIYFDHKTIFFVSLCEFT